MKLSSLRLFAGLALIYILLPADLLAERGSLNIAEGVVVQFGENTGLVVEGRLVVDDGVVLTGLNDPDYGGQIKPDAQAPQPGHWLGVELDPGAGADAIELFGLTLRYAAIALGPILHDIDLSALTLRDNLLGMRIDDGASPELTGLVALDNYIGIEVSGQAAPLIRDVEFAGNTLYAIRNLTPAVEVDARDNWWGDASGPYHPVLNPDGLGDAVGDGVLFEPVLIGPPLRGCTVDLADGLYQRTDPDIELLLVCRNAVAMRLSEDPDFSDADYQPFMELAPFVLSSESGEKQVFVEFRSVAGDRVVVQLPQPIQFQSPWPEVTILAPVDGQLIVEDTFIQAQVSAAHPISQVRFHVGQQLLGSLQAPPYEMNWAVNGFAPGPHSVRVRAIDVHGYQTEEVVAVELMVDEPGDEPIARDNHYSVEQDDELIVNVVDGIFHNDTVPLGVDELELVSDVLNGSLSMAADGSFSYQPAPGFFGADRFIYRIHSDGMVSNQATANIAVTPPNRPPVANDLSFVTGLEQTLVVSPPGVLANDHDPDGDPLSAELVAPPVAGALTLFANGSFTYEPEVDFIGTVDFGYRAVDPHGLSDVATVSITVAGDPIAEDDFYQGVEGQVLVVEANLGVLANDELNGQTVTVELVQPPAQGSLQLFPDGSFVYQPVEFFFGEVDFRYRLVYSGGVSAPATVLIDLAKVNHPPVAQPLLFIADYQMPLAISAENGVLSNDFDVHGDSLTAHLVEPPQHGQIDLAEDGSFNYLPDTGFLGVDQFIYAARDPEGLEGEALIRIDVTPGPMALNDVYFLAVDETLELDAHGVLSNDFHRPQNNPLSAVLVKPPEHGTAILNADGALIYQPEPGFQGIDFLEYLATTGESDSNVATVTFAVGTTSFPIAQSVEGIVGYQGQTLVYNDSVLDNDIEPSGLPMTASIVPGSKEPWNGPAIELNSDGSFVVQVGSSFRGDLSFRYVAFNGSQISNEATVGITIEAVNQGVNARDDFYSLTPGETLTVSPGNGVLRNDFRDPLFGDVLVTLESPPSHGSLDLQTNGAFTYIPDPGFVGTDSFVYRVEQVAGDQWDTAVVTLTANSPPVLEELHLQLVEDSFYDFVELPNPLATAWDPDGDEVWIYSSSGNYPVCQTRWRGPGRIRTCLQQDGTLSIETMQNFCGFSGRLTYQATDGIARVTGGIYLEVEPTPDAPVARDDSYLMLPDQLADIPREQGVLVNDFDPDKLFEGFGCFDPDTEPTRARLVEAPSHGSLVLDADGAFRYTPDAGFAGTDSFVYEAFDGTERFDQATVTLTVNAPPVGAPNFYQLDENSVLSIPAPGVLENDTDPNPDTTHLRARRFTPSGQCSPCHGSLVLRSNGSFDYQPAVNFHGADRFWYQVGNGLRWSEPVEVNLQIFRVRHPLQLEPDLYRGFQDTVLVVAPSHGVLINDEELDGLNFWVDGIAVEPQHGLLEMAADGSFVYTPDPVFHGVDTFHYRAINESGLTAEAEVELVIRHVNSAPVAADDAYEVEAGATLAISADEGVLANDFDIDGDPLQAFLVRSPAVGSVVLATDGSFVFEAPSGPSQVVTWSYQVRDGKGGIDAARVEMRIINPDDPPLPVLHDVQYLVEGEQLMVPSIYGVLANDLYVTGYQAVLVEGPEHGSLNLNGDGGFIYTAAPGLRTPQTFRYGLLGMEALSALVTLEFLGSGPVLVARDSGFYQFGEGLMAVPPPGVMANDEAVGAQAELVSAPPSEHGELVLEAGGGFSFTPRPGFTGQTTFQYRLRRDSELSNVAQVLIQIELEEQAMDRVFRDRFENVEEAKE
jgi:hypothetical protein